MRIRVRAGVQQTPAEIYDMAADSNRAMLLYHVGVQEGFEREQYDDGEGTYCVLVTAEAEKLLPLLAPIVAGDDGVAPFRCEWVRSSTGGAAFEDEGDAERRAEEVWRRHGPDGSGVVYLMEEA